MRLETAPTGAVRKSYKGCISYTLKKLNITRKKTLTYKEQCPRKRRAYLDALACQVQGAGKTPAYVDECGFPSSEKCPSIFGLHYKFKKGV